MQTQSEQRVGKCAVNAVDNGPDVRRTYKPSSGMVYFPWTYQISHKIRISLTDSQLNRKWLLTLKKMLSRIAVKINLDFSRCMQAIRLLHTSPALTATTEVRALGVCQGCCTVRLQGCCRGENIWTGNESCLFTLDTKKIQMPSWFSTESLPMDTLRLRLHYRTDYSM